METSLKTGFAQVFYCCPKNLSCPNFGGGCSPPRPPGPYAYGKDLSFQAKPDTVRVARGYSYVQAIYIVGMCRHQG